MILFENNEIVCIITGYNNQSENAKTGSMLQTWILVRNSHPVEAIRNGADTAICGNCPHRGDQTQGGFVGRSCYVDIVTGGPSAVWRAYQRGAYDRLEWIIRKGNALTLSQDSVDWLEQNVEGRMVRLGSYGDPAFVPLAVWDTILEYAGGHTGYTHQWQDPSKSAYRGIVMASCDSERDLFEAQAMGWRTFRVRAESDPILPVEIVCPASEEAGKRRTCETCRACDGAGTGRSVTIIAHGKGKRNFVGSDLVQIV